MELEKLKSLKLAHPFRPFYLILKDGRRFLIERSYQFGMAPDGSRVGISTGPGVVLTTLADVVGVDMLSPALNP